MSDRPWHKRYHSDALSGFIVLSLEERGAFQTLLDLMYDRGGPMPDNDGLLARYMGVSIRKWRSLRESLIGLGKIREDGGFLFNDRAVAEIENGSKTSRKLAENGSKGGRKKHENEKKRNENNESDENGLEKKPSISEARDQKREPSVLANSGSLDQQDFVGEDIPAKPKGQPTDAAFRDWEKAAIEKGWPVPRLLSDQRRRKLAARLRVHGRDGWRAALTKAWESPLLGGSEPPSWFNFDWITKNDENLLKVLEGNYDRTGNGFGSPAPQTYAPSRDRSPAELEDARQRLAERGEFTA